MQTRFLLKVLASAFVALALAATVTATAKANPRGLSISNESCASGGTVEARLNWTADGAGQQFVDLSPRNDNFTSAHSTGGPFASNQTQAQLVQLQPGSTYYLRVSAQVGNQFLRSETLAYTTRSCAGGGGLVSSATPPRNLQAFAPSATSAQFRWDPGNGNRFYCVDYAKSAADLLARQNTWRNSGCGTTANALIVSNLSCGTTYFARVWTSAGGGLYSPMSQVTTPSCSTMISPPTELEVLFATPRTARVAWMPGNGNRWFCVDTAKTRSDLRTLGGTWRNQGCWSMESELTLTGLTCETRYFWRVYAWNSVTNVHSGRATLETASCNAKLVEAPVEKLDVRRIGSRYEARITVALPDACHSFGSYEVERSGNRIEITVFNLVEQADVCAQVFTTHLLTIDLGSNFVSDVRYTVEVNEDTRERFTAR